MDIRHEGPHPNTHWQVQAPLLLELSDRSFIKIDNWSLEGLEWPHDASECPTDATLHIPFQGVNVSFAIKLKHSTADNHATFDGLNGRHRETLALFHRALLSGQMTSTPDVIRALDTPLDLVPMGETEEEKSEGLAKTPPRHLRIVVNLVIYTGLALMLLWILGGTLASKAGKIDIGYGRVLPQNATLCDVPYSAEVPKTSLDCARLVPPQGSATSDQLAVGWVPQDQIKKVYIGMPARAMWNTRGQTSQAKGEVVEIIAHADPQGSGDFAISVVVKLLRPTPDHSNALPSGRPVELTAIRPLYAKASAWLTGERDAHE